MAISSIPYNVLSVKSNKALANGTINSSDEQTAADLEKQIQKNKEASVDYQIIKRMIAADPRDSTGNRDKSFEAKNAAVNKEDQLDSISISAEAEQTSRTSFSVENTGVGQAVNSVINRREQASLSVSMSSETGAENVQKKDPLALDLNGNGLQTTGVEKGVLFDVDGDGSKEQTSIITGGDAFLAYDKNGNGVIDNGKELFGDSNGYQHGFAELASYDDNQDGKIDASDSIFNQLKLLTYNQNGEQELVALNKTNIASINVNYSDHNQSINQYDTIAQLGQFEYKNGQKGIAGDLLLGYKNLV